MTDMSLRRWFDHYIDACNRGDLDAVAGFYAADMQMTDDSASMASASAAMAYHQRFAGRATQTLEVLSYVDRPGRIAAEIRSTWRALVDVPDFPDAPLAQGDQRASVSFVIHDIADGHFTRIRSALYKAAR